MNKIYSNKFPMYGLFLMKNEIKIVYLSICLYIFVLLQVIYFYSNYIFLV